jgi:uncharacterized membrane protein YphA (DoxX/SURF4 family)
MDTVLWIAQILLAGVFLYAGFSKVFVYEPHPTAPDSRISSCVALPHGLAAAIAIVEIAGAVAVVVPIDLWPPDIFLRLVTAGLAVLTLIAAIYHARREEPTAPIIAVFFLALFVIVGRWPR